MRAMRVVQMAVVLVRFLVDTSMSLVRGVMPNAMLNTGMFLFLVVPLIATRRAFDSGHDAYRAADPATRIIAERCH